MTVYNCRRPPAAGVSTVPIVDMSTFFSGSSLPASISLRRNMPPIRDQRFSDSASNAVASMCQYTLQMSEPSAQWLYSRVRAARGLQGQDVGSSITDEVLTAASQGVCTTRSWPNNAAARTSSSMVPPASCVVEALSYQVLTKSRVAANLASLKACLCMQWPVACGLTVYSSFTLAGSNAGVVPIPNTLSESRLGGIGAVLIGYDDARGCFEVRFDLGPTWGDAGHGWLPYAYVTNVADTSAGVSGVAAWDFWQISAIPDAITVLPQLAPLAIPATVVPSPAAVPSVVVPNVPLVPTSVVVPAVVPNVAVPEVWIISSNINMSQVVEGQMQTPDMNLATTVAFVTGIRRRFTGAYIVLAEVSFLTAAQMTSLMSAGVSKVVVLATTLALNLIKVLAPSRGLVAATNIAETFVFYSAMMDLLGTIGPWKSANFITGTFSMTLASNNNVNDLGWYSKPNSGILWDYRYTWMSETFSRFIASSTGA